MVVKFLFVWNKPIVYFLWIHRYSARGQIVALTVEFEFH